MHPPDRLINALPVRRSLMTGQMPRPMHKLMTGLMTGEMTGLMTGEMTRLMIGLMLGLTPAGASAQPKPPVAHPDRALPFERFGTV